MERYILSIDSGSSSCKAALIDKEGNIRHFVAENIHTSISSGGQVTHDPWEIWNTTERLMKQLVEGVGIDSIDGITIANQRESVVAWGKGGQTIGHCISWQDTRMSFNESPDFIRQKTGLYLSPYFSAPKIQWIIQNLLQNCKLDGIKFGTIDSWLIWNLTQGKQFVTDVSNASRTLLFNIYDLQWDAQLLEYFGIPIQSLAKVQDSASIFGYWSGIPICGVLGDQQSSMFIAPICKCTYGTGAFLMNTIHVNETRNILLKDELLISIGWKNPELVYVVEGAVLGCGNTLHGNSHKTTLLRIAHNVHNVLKQMKKYTHIPELLVDGGLSKSSELISMQTNISKIEIFKSKESELTILGVAVMGGIYIDFLNYNQLCKIKMYVKS